MTKNLYGMLLIREGEQGNVFYFLLFFLLVSTGMAIGRGTVDALFLKRLGIEYIPVMYVIQSVVLAAISFVYAGFADRIPAERFFRTLFISLALLVGASWFAMTTTDSTLVYPAYYLVYEVASELMLVHAALYMNQNMNTLQAKRLAPLAFAGVQVGTISGGLILVFGTPVFGTGNLLLAWCLLLIASLAALTLRHRRIGTSTHFRAPARSDNLLQDCTQHVREGVSYTVKSDLLRSASFALFFMVVAFYILCYSVNRVYTQTFESEESLTRFFGILSATTGSIALFLQVFITGRAIRRFGVRTMNLVFPWTTIFSLGALTMSFALPTALIGSINKDSIMTAFRNPVRSIFLNVLPGHIQGRARAMAVAIVLPLALMTCGLLLLLLQKLEQPVMFLAPGIIAALLYLFWSRKMNRAYVTTLLATLKERLHLPNRRMYASLSGSGDEILEEILRGVRHEDPEVCIAFSRMLAGSFRETAAEVLTGRLQEVDIATADRLARLLEDIDISQHTAELSDLASRGDPHLNASITGLLLKKADSKAISHAQSGMESDNPRLRALAVSAALRYPASAQLREHAITTWNAMLEGQAATQLAALDLIPVMEALNANELQAIRSAYCSSFDSLLDNRDDRVVTRALRGMQAWKNPLGSQAQSRVAKHLGSRHPEVRLAAAGCLYLVDEPVKTDLQLKAVGDCNIQVRQAVINELDSVPGRLEDFALHALAANAGSLRAQHTLIEALNEHGLPSASSQQVARAKINEAHRLQGALHLLKIAGDSDESPAMQLLAYALQEHFDQNIEMALLALEPLYEPGAMRVISTGFMSGDPRHIANAIEALETISDDEVLERIHDMLLHTVENTGHHDASQFASLADVLEWCRSHKDSWLREICSNLGTPMRTETA